MNSQKSFGPSRVFFPNNNRQTFCITSTNSGCPIMNGMTLNVNISGVVDQNLPVPIVPI